VLCVHITSWSEWLAEADDTQKIEILRRNAEKGLPCGADKFIQKLENMAGKPLHYRPLGHPKKDKDSKKG